LQGWIVKTFHPQFNYGIKFINAIIISGMIKVKKQ